MDHTAVSVAYLYYQNQGKMTLVRDTLKLFVTPHSYAPFGVICWKQANNLCTIWCQPRRKGLKMFAYQCQLNKINTFIYYFIFTVTIAIIPQILAHKLAAHLLCTCDMEVTRPNLCVMLTFYYETMQFLLCSPLSQFISGHNS